MRGTLRTLLPMAILCLTGLCLVGGFSAYRDVTTAALGEELSWLESRSMGHHHGSPSYANGDKSTLTDGNGTEGFEDFPFVVDRTCGEGRAVVLLENNGQFADKFFQDENGCTPGGNGGNTGTNWGGHITCRGINGDGTFRGCQDFSNHGR